MSSWKWTVAAIVGAAVGTAIWIALGTHFGAPLGWCAVGVGLMSGIALRLAAGEADDEERVARGITAVIIAVLAICVAKYNVASQTMVTEEEEYWQNFATVDEESMIGTIADQIVLARMNQGQTIAWPDEDMTYEDALWEDDYPPEIWAQARERWLALSEGEQRARQSTHEANVQRLLDYYLREPRRAAFYQSFGSWDLVWFALACASAFVIAGGYREA
jgi:hypothetical protein